MNVFSELKEAQLEVLPTDPASPVRGRIFYSNTTNPIKIHDGTQFHRVLTDKMYADIKLGIFPTGILGTDVNTSTVIPARNIGVNYGLSTSSGVVSVSSTTFADVANLSVTITTSGKPVEISLVGGTIGMANLTGTSPQGSFKIQRNNEDIRIGNTTNPSSIFSMSHNLSITLSSATITGAASAGTVHTHPIAASTLTRSLIASVPSGFIRFIDTVPAAGTYTYKIQASTITGSTLSIQDVQLFVREL